jgi:hypothetical protein
MVGKQVSDPTKPTRSLHELVQAVGALSQSATVLVACAVLDTELERALKVIMRPMRNTLYSRLFENYGPLSSFSSKIDLAYALNITTDDVHANLCIIKKIRNKFAHTTEILTLESDIIQKLYQRLKKPTEPKKNTTSDVFLECVDGIVSFLEEYLTSKGETDELSRRAHATLAKL